MPKKFFLAGIILVLGISAANAGNDKNIVICYFNDSKIVFENVGQVLYYNSGEVKIQFSRKNGGGAATFSGAFVCLEAEDSDTFVGDIKERFGGQGIGAE